MALRKGSSKEAEDAEKSSKCLYQELPVRSRIDSWHMEKLRW